MTTAGLEGGLNCYLDLLPGQATTQQYLDELNKNSITGIKNLSHGIKSTFQAHYRCNPVLCIWYFFSHNFKMFGVGGVCLARYISLKSTSHQRLLDTRSRLERNLEHAFSTCSVGKFAENGGNPVKKHPIEITCGFIG